MNKMPPTQLMPIPLCAPVPLKQPVLGKKDLPALEMEARGHLQDGLASNLALGDVLNQIIGLRRDFKSWVRPALGITYETALNYRRAATRFPLGEKRTRILTLLPTVVYELTRTNDDDLVERALKAVAKGEHVTAEDVARWSHENAATDEIIASDRGQPDQDWEDEAREEALNELVAIFLELPEPTYHRTVVCLMALGFDAKAFVKAVCKAKRGSSSNMKVAA